jgi:DNA replication protein DnaC
MSPKKRTPHELIERIRDALKDLRLTAMAQQLDELLGREAVEDGSRLEFVWQLLEPQLNLRRQRSVEYRIRKARFPCFKSLDNFEFAFQKKLDRDRILELATLDFVRRGQNLLVAGMSGTGKSHICIALGYLACAAGVPTRYTTSADMLAELHAGLATGLLQESLKSFVQPQLLIIDEVGLDRPERDATPDAQLFYKVIRPRHEGGRSTVITSNIAWDKWGVYLGDDVATVAILDRLIEHGHLMTIEGPSYRAAEHTKLNTKTTNKAGNGRGTKPRRSS